MWYHARIRSWNQPVLGNKGKVSCSRKQRWPLIGHKPMTSTLRVRCATHCARPPLRFCFQWYSVLLSMIFRFCIQQYNFFIHFLRAMIFIFCVHLISVLYVQLVFVYRPVHFFFCLFQLFLDDSKMKNFTSCFKGKCHFFTQIKVLLTRNCLL